MFNTIVNPSVFSCSHGLPPILLFLSRNGKIVVDPRSDFFSIYVRGLTNAYRWQDPPNGFKAGDPPGTGRRFLYKTLQLNFWRPGDSLDHNEDEIRFGVPNQNQLPSGITEDQVLKAYGLKERVDYQWVYR